MPFGKQSQSISPDFSKCLNKERKVLMYCMKCGQQIPDDSKSCVYCGENLQAKKADKDPNAVLGLVSMILGFVALGTQVLGIASGLSMPSAIAALVCGFLAKNRAGQDAQTVSKAKTGIICAFAGIGVSLLNAIIAFVAVVFVLVIYLLMFGSMIAMGI